MRLAPRPRGTANLSEDKYLVAAVLLELCGFANLDISCATCSMRLTSVALGEGALGAVQTSELTIARLARRWFCGRSDGRCLSVRPGWQTAPDGVPRWTGLRSGRQVLDAAGRHCGGDVDNKPWYHRASVSKPSHAVRTDMPLLYRHPEPRFPHPRHPRPHEQPTVMAAEASTLPNKRAVASRP
jgi:hypothetical protein